MAVRQYIGARYMPKFVGTYDPTQAYEALSVVDNGSGTTYVCNQPTPPNTPLTDGNYWILYGSSSGAILHLQEQIDDMNDGSVPGSLQNQVNDINQDINDIVGDLATIKYDIIVDIAGTGDYTSLSAAVAAASDGAKIYVKKGTYTDESVDCQTKTLVIIGADDGNVTIQNTYDEYSRAPIEIGSGYVKNLRFVSAGTGGQSPSYGAHVDYNIMAGKTLIFDNCYFESRSTYAIGVGTRNHGKLILKDCELIGSSGAYGAMFIHSSTVSSDYGSDQQAIFINCRFYSLVQTVLAIQGVGTSDNNLYLTFLGCMLNTTSGDKTGLISRSAYNQATGQVIIMPGAGNNYGHLNQQEYNLGTTTIGKYGDLKSVKKTIFEGTLVANTAKNVTIPSDCEKILECHVLIKETSSSLWYPAGTKAPGTNGDHQAFYVNENGNKSMVIQSSDAGEYIATIVYISSNTASV